MPASFQDVLRASLEDDDNDTVSAIAEGPSDEEEGEEAPEDEGEREAKAQHNTIVMDEDVVIGSEFPSDANALKEVIDGAIVGTELVESLEALIETVDNIRLSGQVNMGTAIMLRSSVENLLSPHEVSFEMVSMESIDDDPEYFVQVTLEGLGDFVKRLKENLKNWWKSFKDSLAYEFKSRNERLVQLDRRLREAKAFVQKRKVDLKKLNYRFEFGGLVKLFRINGEVVTDISQALDSDYKCVSYITNDYQAQVHKTIVSLGNVLSGARIKDNRDVDALISKIAAIPNPPMHMGTVVTRGYPFMGNFKISVSEGKVLKGANYGELGRKCRVYAGISGTQILKDIGRQIIFGDFATLAESSMNSARMDVESLEASLDMLTKYVAMVRNSVHNSSKSAADFDKIWIGYTNILTNLPPDLDRESVKMLNNIEKVIMWLTPQIDDPFNWVCRHAFLVMGNVIMFQEHLARKLK